MNLRRLLLPALAASVALAMACSSGSSSTAGVKVGAILPLSGSLQSYGETSKAALEAARDTINASAKDKLTLVIEDDKTDPPTALKQLQALHSQGIKVVVGPYASSAVQAVKDYANQNGMVLISPLSTATSLAQPGDNIYRFTPDDSQEGKAVADVAYADDVRTIVPLSRNDAGNLGLQSSMKASFEAAGGTVLTGITYGTDVTDFTKTVSDLVALLQSDATPKDQTAVYLTAFDEVTDLFAAASTAQSDVLKSVHWYGSDSVAQSKELVADGTAAAFAVAAGYPNPILGLREADKDAWQPVVDSLAKKLGRTPDAFALAAYDALVVAKKAIDSAGGDADANALGAAIVQISDTSTGLTGPLKLNDAGDRAVGNYDFWSVCPDGAKFTWARTISYAAPAATGGAADVQRFSC